MGFKTTEVRNLHVVLYEEWIAPCKGIQGSVGFWTPRRGFRIPGTGFQSLSVELGFWTPIVSGIPDSFSLRCRRNLTRLVTSAKQRRDPCSWPPTDSTNYRNRVSNFLSTWLANRQWLLKQADHGAYSNPGTQVGTQNKDFGAFS